MSTVDELRTQLRNALHTSDWLSAIAATREILDQEPDAMRERQLLAQLYLRVSGSRLATIQFRKLLLQAIRNRNLWQAVIAQKFLDASSPDTRSDDAYSSIHNRIVESPSVGFIDLDQPMGSNPAAAEEFEELCADFELVNLVQNERWEGEPGALIAAPWGRLWLEVGESGRDVAEGDLVVLESDPAGAPPALLAMEEISFLHMPSAPARRWHSRLTEIRTAEPLPADAPPMQHEALEPSELVFHGERDEVLLASRCILEAQDGKTTATLNGVLYDLDESGARLECEFGILPMTPEEMSGAKITVKVVLRNAAQPYQWSGRLAWIRTGVAGGLQGFSLGIHWRTLDSVERAEIYELREGLHGESQQLWQLWNSATGTDR